MIVLFIALQLFNVVTTNTYQTDIYFNDIKKRGVVEELKYETLTGYKVDEIYFFAEPDEYWQLQNQGSALFTCFSYTHLELTPVFDFIEVTKTGDLLTLKLKNNTIKVLLN